MLKSLPPGRRPFNTPRSASQPQNRSTSTVAPRWTGGRGITDGWITRAEDTAPHRCAGKPLKPRAAGTCAAARRVAAESAPGLLAGGLTPVEEQSCGAVSLDLPGRLFRMLRVGKLVPQVRRAPQAHRAGARLAGAGP